MKSIKSENMQFSTEDFIQGLMLAGYLSPATIEELNQRQALEEYEAKLTTVAPQNVYFKRVVLAAEIVSKLHEEPTMGRIKFQKLVFLCEHVANMDLHSRYSKQAAGPFDNKFMHSINREFKKNKWFAVEQVKSGIYNRSKYIPLENSEGFKRYYENYFKTENEHIQYIIELFRKTNTDFTELATTVFACVLELKSEYDTIQNDRLLTLFYNWSEKKNRFKEEQVIKSLTWLCDKGLVDPDIIEQTL